MTFLLIVLILGFIAGFLSGLLAVGGGIIIIPVFLYILPLLGFKALPMNQITGISSVQVIVGSLFAFLSHRKYGLMDKRLLYSVGIAAGIGALTGAIISKFVTDKVLLIIYFIALSISLFFLIRQPKGEDDSTVTERNSLITFILSLLAGTFSGALGVGGAVLYIPILTYCYGMSLKTGISNVTYIVFITAIATFLGKTATNQVPFDLVVFIILGAWFGARLGTKISHKLSTKILKNILITIIAVTVIRVLISILH